MRPSLSWSPLAPSASDDGDEEEADLDLTVFDFDSTPPRAASESTSSRRAVLPTPSDDEDDANDLIDDDDDKEADDEEDEEEDEDGGGKAAPDMEETPQLLLTEDDDRDVSEWGVDDVGGAVKNEEAQQKDECEKPVAATEVQPSARSKAKAPLSRLPLMLPSERKLLKTSKDTLLIQLENKQHMKLVNDTGAVGRMAVSEEDGSILLDLLGTKSWGELCRTPSLLVIDVGRAEATIEIVVDSVLLLRTRRDHLSDMNPYTTGAGEGDQLQPTPPSDQEAEDRGGESCSSDSEAPSARASKKPKFKKANGRGGRKRGNSRGSRGKSKKKRTSTKKQGTSTTKKSTSNTKRKSMSLETLARASTGDL